MEEIEKIKKEYDEILNQLGNPEFISDWKKFNELQKRKNFLEKIINKEKQLNEIKLQIEENKEILAAEKDQELLSLAEQELKILLEKQKLLNDQLNKLLKEFVEQKSLKAKSKKAEAVLVEIRAGVGGEEAALFVADLFRMYSKFAESQGWKQKILDSRPTSLGGFKEIIFELSNNEVFSKMQYEGGVHRVQRIPVTEKTGRIHTSTASVAILPKPKTVTIKIRPQDLKIDFYRASGPGGQYVNRRETAVRITHLPSGIVVTSQTERNQLQNKENAMKILEARLLEKKEMEELEKIHGKRKAQIKWAKRAEKIRTYNFPQDRITDHRIKKSWHNIEEIMAGKLEPIVQALTQSEIEI